MRVQVTRWLPVSVLAGALAMAWAPRCAAQDDPEEPAVGTLVRFFTGSDHVAVRSLMGDYTFTSQKDASLAIHWNNERVTIPAIDAPVGSAAAIDAITTASRPISGNAFQDFAKVRNEFQGALSRHHAALDYYLSTESDYLGQQIGARYDKDLSGQQLNLAFGTSYGWDAITPVADDDTRTAAATKTTLHWNAIATRILTATTLVRVGLEYNRVDGLQHNPYRNVYAGGTVVPERHPDHRDRRDLFLKLNQYLQNRSSIKLSYRFYTDDWGIVSHEIGSKLSQYVTHGAFAEYQYRYYTQGDASFYRSVYPTIDGVGGYLTGDYRMAALSSHLFGVALNLDFGALTADSGWMRRLRARMSYDRYFNSNNYSANILESGVDFRF
jgi:uncharacterized protein DUF3570